MEKDTLNTMSDKQKKYAQLQIETVIPKEKKRTILNVTNKQKFT